MTTYAIMDVVQRSTKDFLQCAEISARLRYKFYFERRMLEVSEASTTYNIIPFIIKIEEPHEAHPIIQESAQPTHPKSEMEVSFHKSQSHNT
jgi:hypothetical protein